MVDQEDSTPGQGPEDEQGADPSMAPAVGSAEGAEVGPVAELGVTRYVHAAFFALGVLAAYISGKVLLGVWNTLSDMPQAVAAVPQLIEFTEEQRASYTLIVGAVLGAVAVLRYYRRPSVRTWSADVAGELSRVTWPGKELVTNGTIIVVIASVVATVYVALLDRFWGYLTNLVYGA